MQGNGETEKPTQHTDEEDVGSRWSKPEQQLGMPLRKTRLATAKFLPGVDNPFGRRMVRQSALVADMLLTRTVARLAL